MEFLPADLDPEALRQAALHQNLRAAVTETFTPNEVDSGPILTLGEFIEGAWSIVEPSTPYLHNWHIDAVVEHLEAVTRGEIRDLLINIPPRHGKSLIVSVFWPTWVWTFAPEFRWLFSSYAQSLSTRDSLKCRRIIQSRWYQSRWGARVNLTSDQNVKTRFENDRSGYRIATSVGGAGTGEGGDAVVVDDPHNVKKAESDLDREGIRHWWDEVMSTRLNDPKTGVRVMVMQRVHEEDLAGHVLDRGGYEHLCIPAEYEPTTTVTSLGWSDPRTEEDELLWEERIPRPVLEKLKIDLGIYGTAGQLQQRPSPRGGGMFQREWFEVVDAIPKHGGIRGRYWDKAGTQGGGKYTAGVRGYLHDGIMYFEDVVRGQWDAAHREPKIKITAQSDADECDGAWEVTIWIEQEPGSGGKESAELTVKNLGGFVVRIDRVSGSGGNKFVRAGPLAAAALAGNVKLLRGEWNRPFLDELEAAGPGARYLDQMDGAAGLFNKLSAANTEYHGDMGGFTNEGLTRTSPWR